MRGHSANILPDASLKKPAIISDGTSTWVWMSQCRSKVDYELIEKVRGRDTNTVSGLELHTSVLSPSEQVQMVETIERWVASGKRGEMSGRTFSAPRRSMPGKGRITCQFGCCYNYAVDQQGRKPGQSLSPHLQWSQHVIRWTHQEASSSPIQCRGCKMQHGFQSVSKLVV